MDVAIDMPLQAIGHSYGALFLSCFTSVAEERLVIAYFDGTGGLIDLLPFGTREVRFADHAAAISPRFRPGRADQGIGDADVAQNPGDDPVRKGLAARLRDPVQRANGFQRALGG
jgi:hypothetical protein